MFIMQIDCCFFCHSPCLSMNIQEKNAGQQEINFFAAQALRGVFTLSAVHDFLRV